MTDANGNSTPTPAQRRCVIYARCSTRDQETDNQIAALTKHAEKENWILVDIVVDVCSGSKQEREGFERINELAKSKQFDLLLFWALDRFSREGSRKTIARLSELEDMGVDFHSYSEPYISSLGIFKDAIIAILSALAKQERIRISERTKAGLQRVKANGTVLGRPACSPERLDTILALRRQGLSVRSIGRSVGMSFGNVSRLVREHDRCAVSDNDKAHFSEVSDSERRIK